MTTPEPKPLTILIAGAGIGGLSAAIALRQAGHYVEIFESSRFAIELGAAIHLPPNVNGLLRRFGINPEEFQCNDAEFVTVFDSQGNIISSKDVRDLRSHYPYPWQLSHRIDLHEALKKAATSPNGPGVPAKIHLASRVVSCDPHAPALTLADGRVVQGELVVGADGVHSILRQIIAQEDLAPTPSGGSAFRFLVPIDKAKENALTRGLVARPGELQLWDGTYRRLVIYPCRNNTELNFVCLHSDTESESTEGWNNAGSLNQMTKIYDEFCPEMKALLGMVNPDEIKLWRLLDRKALKTWVFGKSCLLGDAAHPFLPHQGQGGAQAIEDGAALGALLPLGTLPDDIPARLDLYMKCRYSRASMVQDFSRQAAFKTSAEDQVGGMSVDPLEFSRINFGHDAYDYAQNMLRKNPGLISTNSPLDTIFGPPQQLLRNFAGISKVLGDEAPFSWRISFKTRRSYLETFLPSTDSTIQSPDGWATADIIITHHEGSEWTGRADHTSVALSIPNALLSTDRGTSETFVPIIFDNNIDFVTAGNAEHSLPLYLADIEEEMTAENTFSITVSRAGHGFLGVVVETPGQSALLDDGGEVPDLEARVLLSGLSEEELGAECPGIAHVVGRIRGLDIVEVTGVEAGMRAF